MSAVAQPKGRQRPDFGPGKPFFSASQIGKFLRCARQWHYRYREGVRQPPGGVLLQGTAWHAAIEVNYRQKIESGEDLPPETVGAAFCEEFDRALMDPDEGYVMQPWDRLETLREQGEAMAVLHTMEIAPQVQPMLVEHPFRMDLGDDFPWDIVGVWDVVEKNGTIRDNKSKGRKPTQRDFDQDVQFTVYSMAYRALYGEIEPRICMDLVTRAAKPKALVMETRRTNRECEWLLGLIEQMAAAIEAGVFVPNPVGWHCDSRWCEAYEQCWANE